MLPYERKDEREAVRKMRGGMGWMDGWMDEREMDKRVTGVREEGRTAVEWENERKRGGGDMGRKRRERKETVRERR